jgi:hypothetical protein
MRNARSMDIYLGAFAMFVMKYPLFFLPAFGVAYYLFLNVLSFLRILITRREIGCAV